MTVDEQQALKAKLYAENRTAFLKAKEAKMSKRQLDEMKYLEFGYGRHNIYSNRNKK